MFPNMCCKEYSYFKNALEVTFLGKLTTAWQQITITLKSCSQIEIFKNLLLIYSFRLACLKKTRLHQNHNNVLLLDTTGFWRPGF